MTLDSIGLKYGTDKASSHHNYLHTYESYFAALQYQPLNILEIGVFGGRSMRMWEEYFINSKIYGLECVAKKAYNSDRCKTFIGYQNDREFLKNVGDTVGSFDVVIDDGSHKSGDQQISLGVLFKYVSTGGLYIIEDLKQKYNGSTMDLYSNGFKSEYITEEDSEYIASHLESYKLHTPTKESVMVLVKK